VGAGWVPSHNVGHATAVSGRGLRLATAGGRRPAPAHERREHTGARHRQRYCQNKGGGAPDGWPPHYSVGSRGKFDLNSKNGLK
jgi:hypothetical protein